MVGCPKGLDRVRNEDWSRQRCQLAPIHRTKDCVWDLEPRGGHCWHTIIWELGARGYASVYGFEFLPIKSKLLTDDAVKPWSLLTEIKINFSPNLVLCKYSELQWKIQEVVSPELKGNLETLPLLLLPDNFWWHLFSLVLRPALRVS